MIQTTLSRLSRLQKITNQRTLGKKLKLNLPTDGVCLAHEMTSIKNTEGKLP